MNKQLRMIALFAAIGITFAQPAIPQQGQPQPQDMKIDSAVRTQVTEGILRRLKDLYVFPDVAKKIEESIRERSKQGEYDKIESAKELARTLTDHLQAISRDKHLELRFNAGALPDPLPEIGQSAADQEFFRYQNYGFERVERLADHFLLIVPQGLVRNVITGKNWEGVGVTPQVETPSTDALAVAYSLALRRLIEKGTDSVRTSRWQAALESLSSEKRR